MEKADGEARRPKWLRGDAEVYSFADCTLTIRASV
jgi:hypothetical protein